MFKKKWKRYFALCLAATFFVASNGLVLATHICLKDTHRQVSLFTSDNCCKADEDCGNSVPASRLSPTCCITEYNLHQSPPETTLPASASVFACWPVNVAADLLQGTLPVKAQTPDYPHTARAPDPRTGKIFLYSIHCLLV